jgi:hypothetical protein
VKETYYYFDLDMKTATVGKADADRGSRSIITEIRQVWLNEYTGHDENSNWNVMVQMRTRKTKNQIA